MGGFEGIADARRSANESLIMRWIVVGGLGIVFSTLAL